MSTNIPTKSKSKIPSKPTTTSTATPGKTKVTMLLPNDIVRKLRQYALDHNTKLTFIATETLTNFLKRKEASK